MEEIRLIQDAKAKLGECPVWHAEQRSLYWVDVLSNEIHHFDTTTKSDKIIHVGQAVGSIAPRQAGGLVAAMKDGLYFVDDVTGKITQIAAPEKHLPGNRFNDGKCDPAGRFWAGTMCFNQKAEGSLYCMDENLQVKKMLGDIHVSNGISWSPDANKMYYIDTPTLAVWSFDYDIDTGSIKNKQTVVRFPDGEGFPDGMTTDAEGMIWIAHWKGWRVSRWNPATGKKLEEIHVPAEHVTSCTFGGDELDELYITTARPDNDHGPDHDNDHDPDHDNDHGANYGTKQEQPYAGGVFCVKTQTKGLRTNLFAG